MEKKLKQLINKYEDELSKVEDSVDYWHGRKDVVIIFRDNYVEAVKEALILKQHIKDLKEIVGM